MVWRFADVDAAVVKVEPQRLGRLREGEGCCGFGGVGEPVHLGEMERAVGVVVVAEDAAGADRGELLIVTDQPDARTSVDGELDGGVEGGVSAMPASSMITNVDGPTRAQAGRSSWLGTR